MFEFPRQRRIGGGWATLAALACALLAPSAVRAEEKSAVSPNRLKLPKGPGSLEGVGENVEPNLSMGLMTCSATPSPTGACGSDRYPASSSVRSCPE